MAQAKRPARGGVSAADLDAIILAADSLAALESLDDVRRQAVEIVKELVTSTMVAWNEVDLQGRQIDAVISPPLERVTTQSRETLSMAFIEHVSEHPVIAHYARSGDGRPYAISDFLSIAAFHDTRIYRHFYRHLGAEDQLSFVLPDPKLVIGVALNRRRPGFSARDRQVCNLLRPHLLQAYRSVEASTRMKLMASTFEHAATEAGVGVLRLDSAGQLTETNAAARAILHRFFELHTTPSLPPEISQWVTRDRARDTSAELVLHRHNGRRLIIHRTPAPSGDLLLLSAPNSRLLELDTHALGLTARETEVLELVRSGLPTKRIATALAISPRTVDKHVDNALDKLGVRTRLEAVTLIDRITSS